MHRSICFGWPFGILHRLRVMGNSGETTGSDVRIRQKYLGIYNISIFARQVRGAAISMWEREFVLAARAAGRGDFSITFAHILPNIVSVIVVQATISFAIAILAEAALSYLGVGSQPPDPSWGRMLSESQSYIFLTPIIALWPGLAIVLSVLGLNLIGDGLRDLVDPRMARQR